MDKSVSICKSSIFNLLPKNLRSLPAYSWLTRAAGNLVATTHYRLVLGGNGSGPAIAGPDTFEYSVIKHRRAADLRCGGWLCARPERAAVIASRQRHRSPIPVRMHLEPRVGAAAGRKPAR